VAVLAGVAWIGASAGGFKVEWGLVEQEYDEDNVG
jgi:hypothetical protein